MAELDARLGHTLDKRKLKGRHRSLKEYETKDHGSNLVDFSSNDYLSLTTSSALRSNYLSRLASSPDILGSTGSRLLSGSTASHSSLERRFAEFFNSPSALLFNSGWDANVSFFSTIPQRGDWVMYDELVHASVHSGMRASRTLPENRVAFKHNDVESLRAELMKINQTSSQSSSAVASTSRDAKRLPIVFLALESLYSMDGDMAPLPAFLDLMDGYIPRNRQCVVLDEAHSTGVYGRQGRGVTCALGEEGGWSASARGSDLPQGDSGGRVGVRLMTFGKAVGCSGAVLLCSPTIRSFCINFARPLIFSTAIPHSTLHALDASFDVIQGEEGERRRQSLYAISRHLQSRLEYILSTCPTHILRLPHKHLNPFASDKKSELDADPPTSIFGVITPRPHALSAFLLERGFIVRPVVPPTVPPGSERVRLCLRAGMETSIIDRLVDAFQEWVDKEKNGSQESSSTFGAPRGLDLQARAKL